MTQWFRLLTELTDTTRLPVDLLREAESERTALVPVFLDQIKRFLAASAVERQQPTPLFFIFHLLGSWNESSAYPLLAEFLRCSPTDLRRVLGDAISETSHRIMVAVFNGDPEPLRQIILDQQADESVRYRMFEALALLTLGCKIPRCTAATFLQSCFHDLRPMQDCIAWVGWQSAIAILGLSEMEMLVKQAFDRGSIDQSWLTYQHFTDALQRSIGRTSTELPNDYAPFGDVIEELSTWSSFLPVSAPWKRK